MQQRSRGSQHKQYRCWARVGQETEGDGRSNGLTSVPSSRRRLICLKGAKHGLWRLAVERFPIGLNKIFSGDRQSRGHGESGGLFAEQAVTRRDGNGTAEFERFVGHNGSYIASLGHVESDRLGKVERDNFCLCVTRGT